MADAALSVAAVVLAAGQSRRMGRPKLLLTWGETSVLGQTLRHTIAARVDPVLVITGYLAEPVAAIARAAGCRVCHNPDFAAGEMLSSLQVGLRALPPAPHGALVILADQPLVTAETLNYLIAAFEAGLGDIIVPTYEGQPGNPVLIGRRWWADVLALPPGERPRTLLQRQPEAVYYQPLDTPTILIDLDDAAAYAQWRPTSSV